MKGSKVVDENKDFYIVHWDLELCRGLMNKVQDTTLVKRRTFENSCNGRTMIEVQVCK